ncbi:MAG TPA: hypothetical protein VIR03_01570 [Candidatus Saccharimonadales bacterium]
MKDSIEARIIDSQPQDRGNKEFVTRTLHAIKRAKSSETFGEVLRTAKANQKENLHMRLTRFSKIHRALTVSIAVVMALSLSFTGYAYASGTNPIALIRRIVNGGKTVEVEYQGRKFQHGIKHNYTDAAITAYAELNTVSGLHFRANNAFQIPKDSIEHVSDPYKTQYVYPWVGTVESVNAQSVRIHKKYIVGDKVEHSRQADEHVVLPKERVSSYKQGEIVDPSMLASGSVVIIYQDAYLEHHIGSSSKPTSITQYFAFELTHDLASIQEAAQITKDESDESRSIFEPSWGGATNICLNNGADQCDANKQGSTDGESLYAFNQAPNQTYNNPDVIPFGEGAPDPSNVPKELIMRNTQGKITSITNTSIVIKSSSGTLWTLDYSLSNQQSFGRNHKPLSVGDTLAVSVVGSVNDLDNRHFDNQHIYSMRRY